MADMTNAINMSFRVDKDLKRRADELFRNLGMNTSVALNMFLSQSVREQRIPFISTMDIPNKRLLRALEEVEAIENGKVNAKFYDNFEEVLKDLDWHNIKLF